MTQSRPGVSRRAVLLGLGVGTAGTAALIMAGDSPLRESSAAVSLITTTPTYALLPRAGPEFTLSLSGLIAQASDDSVTATSISLWPSTSATLDTQGSQFTGEAMHREAWLGPRGTGTAPASVAFRFHTGTAVEPTSLRWLEWYIEGEIRFGTQVKQFSVPIAAQLHPDDVARGTGSWSRANG